MKTKLLRVDGFTEAFLGLGLSYGKTADVMPDDSTEIWNRMFPVAARLAPLDGGHNKFLESINVWLDITAPLYWWKQFDTYRVGVTKQSESTMHTLGKRKLTSEDFTSHIDGHILDLLNLMVDRGDWKDLNDNLPQGFKQRRIVATNYKVIRHMVAQRKGHKLREWELFIKEMRDLLPFSNEFIFSRRTKNDG